jgi:Cys-tRNA(Pro)/Cys-tRNA(Cys) deacylase
MSKSTRATLALNKVGVNFTLHSYDYDPDAERIGLQAAEAIGIEPRCVLKTLMAEVDGKPVCVIVPSDREVSMKKLAAAFHGKTAKMMRPADAERLTGYHVGGISPFAPEEACSDCYRRSSHERVKRILEWRPTWLADTGRAKRCP